MIKHCIGIDPAAAKPIAVAYWDGLAFKPGWRAHSVENNAKAISHRLQLAKAAGSDLAIIEGGYIGPNPRVGLMLERERGKLIAICEALGLRYNVVNPQTWITDCLSVKGDGRLNHKAVVERAILRAKAISGQDLCEDEAVAVCLAEWGNATQE